MNIKKTFILLIFCMCFLSLFFFSCLHLHERELKFALKMAGANRFELESVINYYKSNGDKQKLEAAKYLIKNMPFHNYMASNLDSINHKIYEEMKQ